MHYIGCDVAKATLDVAWFDQANEQWICREKVSNCASGWSKLLHWATKSCQAEVEQIAIVVEATGVYHLGAAAYFSAAGVRVMVVNPGRAADYAKSQNQLNKNDRLDARSLQQYGVSLKAPHWYVLESPEIQTLRALLARLRQLDRDHRREQNRLEKSGYQTGGKNISGSIKRHIRYLKKEQQILQQQIDTLIVNDETLNHVQQLLLTITGIGQKSSQVLLPLLAPQRFNSARQLAAFLGLTPVHKTSGTSLKKRGRLSGRGNAVVRAQLYMPALAAKRYDPAMSAFYNTLLARGKKPKQALTAIMRKLVHTCYGVVKNDQPYQCPVPA
jgi:transposase